jgi:hypothetical protein
MWFCGASKGFQGSHPVKKDASGSRPKELFDDIKIVSAFEIGIIVVWHQRCDVVKIIIISSIQAIASTPSAPRPTGSEEREHRSIDVML